MIVNLSCTKFEVFIVIFPGRGNSIHCIKLAFALTYSKSSTNLSALYIMALSHIEDYDKKNTENGKAC